MKTFEKAVVVGDLVFLHEHNRMSMSGCEDSCDTGCGCDDACSNDSCSCDDSIFGNCGCDDDCTNDISYP